MLNAHRVDFLFSMETKRCSSHSRVYVRIVFWIEFDSCSLCSHCKTRLRFSPITSYYVFVVGCPLKRQWKFGVLFVVLSVLLNVLLLVLTLSSQLLLLVPRLPFEIFFLRHVVFPVVLCSMAYALSFIFHCISFLAYIVVYDLTV